MSIHEILWEIASYMMAGVVFLLLILVNMALISAIVHLGRKMKEYYERFLKRRNN